MLNDSITFLYVWNVTVSYEACFVWRCTGKVDNNKNSFPHAFVVQIIIGIGAKPAVSPFERVGLNSAVGGIQVIWSTSFMLSLILRYCHSHAENMFTYNIYMILNFPNIRLMVSSVQLYLEFLQLETLQPFHWRYIFLKASRTYIPVSQSYNKCVCWTDLWPYGTSWTCRSCSSICTALR